MRAIADKHRVVVGVVESAEGDSVEFGDLPTVFAPRAATFRVERTLKGDTEPAVFPLWIGPDWVFPGDACSDLSLVYTEGSRMVLMLDEPRDDGSYTAPMIGPWRLRLTSADDYAETALYQYVEGVVQGSPPVSIDIVGSTKQMAWQPLDVLLTIRNELDETLRIQFGGGWPHAIGLTLWLRIDEWLQVPAGRNPGPFELHPGGVLSLQLGDHYKAGDPGHRWIEGDLWLPSGAPELEFPPEPPLFQDFVLGWSAGTWLYSVEVATSITVTTWGLLKSAE